MSDEKQTRPYRLKKRAREMAATRARIVEAAVDLHGSVGPARTTMSAVAERAGVQRNTLYRHFPSEDALFGACSSHFYALHPPPAFEGLSAIDDPARRLAAALEALYRYFGEVEPMFSLVLRDLDAVPALGPTMEPVARAMGELAQALGEGWEPAAGRAPVLRAAIAHALDFLAWRSLTGAGELERGEAVRLMCALVAAASGPSEGG